MRGNRVQRYDQPGPTRSIPRVRGNLGHLIFITLTSGSIPASAGQPAATMRFAGNRSVYPRECGATLASVGAGATAMGLSPRVRGNPALRDNQAGSPRSIPASAGQPQVCTFHQHACRVYPRECGATLVRCLMSQLKWGLSPRVRGNPSNALRCGQHLRSIPASAGQPSTPHVTAGSQTVYPRECGGNPKSVTSSAIDPGSIPASAGQPPTQETTRECPRVYPRECGATYRKSMRKS